MDQVIAPQASLLAGAAQADCTPKVGTYHRMWGAALHEVSTGIHRPLQATALWLQPQVDAGGDGEPILFVAIDHCILEKSEHELLDRAAARATGIDTSRVHVALSHTHGAGLMSRSRADLPGGDLIGPYLDALAETVGRIAAEAKQNAKPASIVAGHGHCDLARQRDYFDVTTEKYVCGFNPHAAADDTVVVAKVTADDGRLIATLVNYACHPTTLAWQNTLVTPDYIGAMRETVMQKYAAPCFFVQGASGDLGPREGFVGDVEVADRNGRILGYAALEALEELPTAGQKFVYQGAVVSGATLGTWKYEPLTTAEQAATAVFRHRTTTVPIDYRADLPTVEETKRDRQKWLEVEAKAQAAGDDAAMRDAHAHVERMNRRLVRQQTLPAGKTYPYPFSVCRTGGILWIAAPGELYQLLQIEIRRRFPGLAVVVATITDDWQPGYFPITSAYGLGIYQETVAVVAPGSLEALVEHFARELEALVR